MRITKRNLLTVILAVLCAVAIALGVGFVMPKNENIKTANAATSSPFTTSELDALAAAAGYANFGALSNAVKNNETVNASKFGAYEVSFGGMPWWPVLAKADSDNIILTLWLKTSIGNYTFSDGTWGYNTAYPCNEYKYSWIRSAINMGQTSDNGDYYGAWPNNTSTAAPTKYANNVKSAKATCAPTAFTTFSSIVGNSFIDKGGDYGDDLWLPSIDEVASGGSWGCTSTQWANNGTTGYCWLRTPNGLDHAIILSTSGSTTNYGINILYGIRPAINVKISGATVSAPTADQTPKPYNLGNILSFPFTFDSSYIDITSVTGEDFYGNAITVSTSNIANGFFQASLAGTYTVTLDLNSDALADDLQWCDDKGGTDKREFTFIINRLGVDVPTIQNTPATFEDSPIDFELSGYDPAIMSVPSNGYYATNGSSISWNNTAGAEKFTATDADEYTVKFQLTDPNYIWKTANGESASDQSKTITINKREIAISTTPSVNLSWGLKEAATFTVVPTVTNIANPDYQLEIYYIKDGDTSNHIITGITGTTLDISKVAATGSYTLCVGLKTSNTKNKNYCIVANNNQYPNVYSVDFTIGAGAIDYSVIEWYYQEDGSTSLNDLFDTNGVQNVIRYKMDSTNGNIINYFITANIQNTGGYLSVANDYNTAPYKNGIYTYVGTQSYNGGASAVGTYTTRIVLNTDADHAFDDAHKLNSDGTLGWYEITWDISKGQIDQNYLNNITDSLKYQVGTTGTSQSYKTNPPEYSGKVVKISIDPTSYMYLGITGIGTIFGDDGTKPGTYTAKVTFTCNPNYENPGEITFTWDIAKQSINVEWTTDTWTAANGDEYQIRVLDIADNLKQYVEYKYYLANPDLTMGSTLIGVDGTGLQELIDNHGASLSSALSIFVQATVKDPNGNYRLVDNTGNTYDCALLYKLGSNNTQANVFLSVTEAEFGSTTINAGILSIIDTDDNSELDRVSFIDRIYITDIAGNEYDWDSFDFSKADKGVYTLKIKLNQDGENQYVLIWKNGHTIEIKPKAIPVPTLSEIVFSNQFVNLADCLGGSYIEYKNIITLGGTYDGVKNVGSYTATLTLTDSNYCWDYGTSATTVRISLAADGVDVYGDDIVATYEWGITPYVLKTSSWNLSGKDGAAYNIPVSLLDGLDVTVNYQYYTDKVSNPLAEGESLVAGSTYFVKAELLGADANNFVFEDSKAATSEFVTYKVPKSGMAAFMGTMKDFFTKTVLGLPVWLWFVIALAVLLFLIIVIAVAAKRRKSKEERLAKKEAKEEEKRRREEERQMQKEKLEAERELAKAKQEVELEKIRAQAGLGMAGMGAASMGMAQQPMQPTMAQNSMGAVDNGILAQIRAELAAVRSDQAALRNEINSRGLTGYSVPQNYAPAPATAPAVIPTAAPAQAMDYHAMYMEERARAAEARLADERIRAAEEKMYHAAEQRAILAEERFVRGGGAYQPQQTAAPQQSVQSVSGTLDADFLGTAIAAALRSNAQSPAAQQEQKTAQEEVVNPAPTQYPEDAIITTTTTVDTSKQKVQSRAVLEEQNFDVDGFYDKYE